MSLSAAEGRAPGRPASHDISSGAMRLVEAVQALSLARELSTVVDIVRRSAREIVRADGATFILRDGDQCHYVDEDAIGPLWKGQRFPMEACVSGWAMTHRRAAVVKDIAEDPRVPYDAYEPTFVKSLVVTPIRVADPIGAIGIYWAVRHAVSDTEIELLQALASSTAVTLENVLLYQTLEQRVADRTRQLGELNRELETFSYSVSHDLQAPLRHISAYSDLLLESKADALDEEARGWLGRIRNSAVTMSELIQAMLRLAVYLRVDLLPAPVSLTKLAYEQAALLKQDNSSRQAEFEIEEGLCVHADESLMRAVLQNLMGNAWKFTARREIARIQVGSTRGPDGAPVYFVRDNGVGFDMQHATKLFAPFQRLHAVKDFQGTGIGLATAKRILYRHGGTIWAEAAVNQGATFFFTVKGSSPDFERSPRLDAPAPDCK